MGRLQPDGKLETVWSTWQGRGELAGHHEAHTLDTPPPEGAPREKKVYDYYHLNSVQVLPENPLGVEDERFRPGHLLVCLRNVNLLAIIDPASGSPTWTWGPGDLDFPHTPEMLPTGNILIFDNGPHRDHSRIVEIDPVTTGVVWEYRAEPPSDFHSRWRGSAQRLANGNTLICESERGRAFEVTPGGEIVWEFWNPMQQGDKRHSIYRFNRLPLDALPWLRTPVGGD